MRSQRNFSPRQWDVSWLPLIRVLGTAGVRARGNMQTGVGVAPGICGGGHSERVWVDNCIRLVNAYSRMGLKD